ncbi:MAG: hypothetical protein H6741_14580 [Alphaproteobacteria bacterium]|nr:hypothetical protein [Alphaproteobacteria bacterium]
MTPMNTGTSTETSERGGGRVWALSAQESQALASILAAHPGGQFKAWVRHQLPALAADPGLSRLALYLERAPRLAQYTARLLEHPENGAARQALIAALLASPEPRARLARLPKGVRGAVAEALEARLVGGMARPT